MGAAIQLAVGETNTPAIAAVSPRKRLDVLVLDEEAPLPANTGKRIRTWNLLRRLAAEHNITLLCHGEPPAGATTELAKAGICVEWVEALPQRHGMDLYARLLMNLFSTFPYSVVKHTTERFRQRMWGLLRAKKYDLVHCEWTPYARYLGDAGQVPSVIATHNVESQIWFRRAQQSRTLAGNLFFWLQGSKMEVFERAVLRQASAVTAVSEQEAAQIRSWGAREVVRVDNGVDLEYFAPDTADVNANEIVYVGSLDWQPNVDAVSYFVEEVLPLLRAKSPDAKLTVIGRKPSAKWAESMQKHKGVEVVGEVPDVRPYLSRAAVVVVPLRIGGGTRLKILEAMAMKKAVVSTTVGAEGLEVEDGVHLRVADAPEAFAQRTVELMTSPDLRERMGEKARQRVEERYGWDALARRQDAAWRQAARESVR
jgi:sugar transferase (PEP-CTERM/EpsH1 system associated)